MEIKRGYLLIIISTMILGLNVPDIMAQLPGLSKIKAEIYVKVTSSVSASGLKGAGNYNIMTEGTTELSADYFDDEEGYYELLPIKRDIKATGNGSGYGDERSWTHYLDGRELKDDYNEFIELINSFYVFPSGEKGKPPTYEINLNADALAAINQYHSTGRRTRTKNFMKGVFQIESGKLASQARYSYVYTSDDNNEVCHINVVYAINQKPKDEDT